jgi:hypothetical protein
MKSSTKLRQFTGLLSFISGAVFFGCSVYWFLAGNVPLGTLHLSAAGLNILAGTLYLKRREPNQSIGT